jgi:DHA2 family multidrug resistance protein
MDAKVKATRAKGLSVDYIGLSLISLGLGSLEVIYAKGQEWDWYNDPFWRAQIIMIVAVVGLSSFIVWELNHPNPIVNVRLMAERNFAACGIIIFLSFAVLYGANVVLPQMLQELFGYDALRAGLVMSPGAFFTMLIMPIVGFLIGKKVDSRFIVPFGLIALSIACYWMGHVTTLKASPWTLNLPRCLMMAGVGCLFVPLNNAAYQYLPKDQINNATGLFNMLRNEGGSLGIAITSTMIDRRAQFHQSRLAEHVTPANPMVDRWTTYYSQIRMARGGLTQWMADQQGFGLMSRMVGQQARFMAYLDIYYIFAIMALVALPFVFLMRKSVSKGGITPH